MANNYTVKGFSIEKVRKAAKSGMDSEGEINALIELIDSLQAETKSEKRKKAFDNLKKVVKDVLPAVCEQEAIIDEAGKALGAMEKKEHVPEEIKAAIKMEKKDCRKAINDTGCCEKFKEAVEKCFPVSKEIKKIGVLTSGGDSPGMNACVRAVVRSACGKGLKAVCIRYGYKGLINLDGKNDYGMNYSYEVNKRDVCDLIQRGGTFIYSARFTGFSHKAMVFRAVLKAKQNKLDRVICIGGDGTFRGALDLTKSGLPCVAIPGTIDNDIDCTDYTIGFDTALNTVVEMVDRLRDTVTSHERCMVVETMGAGSGYLALESGIAVGATYILIPELKKSQDEALKEMVKRINGTRRDNKQYFIIVVAEACTKTKDPALLSAQEIADRIHNETGVDARSIALGHIQRGGSPSAKDRTVASRMGVAAVNWILEGDENIVVIMKGSKIDKIDITEGLGMQKVIDNDILGCAMDISY